MRGVILVRIVAIICATVVLIVGGLSYRGDRADQRRTRVKVNCIVNGGSWVGDNCLMPPPIQIVL